VRSNVHKCVRPYLCLVQVVKNALRSNVKVDVRTQTCNSVCECWGTAVEHTKVRSNAAPCTHSNVHKCVRTQRANKTNQKNFTKFLYKYFFTKKKKKNTQNTQKRIFTQ
jgi:hypothetical protein